MSDAAQTPPMVSLQRVTRTFGATRAVDDVTLDVLPGEFLTLLGPSGCGKTTLLRMISGFETPDTGIVLLDGTDITHLPPYRRNVNQVFQSYALFPHLSVEKNIAFGLRMQGIPRADRNARVAEAIDLVSLAGLESRKPAQLSGGQRQRVALARALVCRPRVLLLDEPLSALDARLRHQMQLELKSLQKRLAITFIFVTHDQEEALTMSDRVAVMSDGKIQQLAPALDVYRNPATAFVAQFIGQTNLLPAQRISPTSAQAFDLTLTFSLAATSATPLLCIRPEKLHLHRHALDAPNTFPVTIESEIFQGPTARLQLLTDTGLRLLALVTYESASQDTFTQGQRAFCHIHPDDVVPIDP